MANKYRVQLLSRDMVADGTMVFGFSKPDGFNYQAGQFAFWRILESTHNDDKGLQRHFTISTAPHEPHLAFTTRLRNSAFKTSLQELPLGTELELDGPMGGFTLPESAESPLIFLAGGIGITPFYAMLKWIISQSLPHRVSLFYSNRNVASAAFLAQLQTITTQNSNLKLFATMTETGDPQSTWNGLTGYISADMIRQQCPDWEQAIYYIAGPPPMVQAMLDLTIQLGIPAHKVKTEKFDGY